MNSHHGHGHGCRRDYPHDHCQNCRPAEPGHCSGVAGHLRWSLHLWQSHLRLNFLCHLCCLLGGVDLPKKCGLRRLSPVRCLLGAVDRMRVRDVDLVVDCYLCSSGMPCLS